MCVEVCLTGGCVLLLALTLVALKVPLKVQTTTSVPNKSLTMLLCVQPVCSCAHMAICSQYVHVHVCVHVCAHASE